MARQLRHIEPGDLLHIYNRGARGQLIFHSDRDRRRFMALLLLYAERHGVEIVAFCLMGNHYHLIVRCVAEGSDVSKMMRDFTSVYVQRFNHDHELDGRMCMDRFCSKRVTSTGYLRYLSAYVHFNPRHLGWQKPLASYPWSSYGAYVGSATRPAWLRCEHVLQHFDSEPDYESFVDRFDPFDIAADLTPTELAASYKRVAPEAVLEVVSFVAGVDVSVVVRGRHGAPNPERDAAMVVLGDHLDLDAVALCEVFEIDRVTTLRSARWRARRNADTDPHVGTLIRSTLDLLCSEGSSGPKADRTTDRP